MAIYGEEGFSRKWLNFGPFPNLGTGIYRRPFNPSGVGVWGISDKRISTFKMVPNLKICQDYDVPE